MSSIKDLVIKALEEAMSVLDATVLETFILVESSGKGFDPKTKKILIQFEPHKFESFDKSGLGTVWKENKIDVQAKEWEAFNDAFRINPQAAMLSTSIGLPQIMGFHWKRLGYEDVGAMWDDFKKGELEQIKALIRFIETDGTLRKALDKKDWHTVAMIYNGKFYREQAFRLGQLPYDVRMDQTYKKLKGG